MTYKEAYNFLKPITIKEGEIWADLGAGDGTFAIPLSDRLGRDGKLYAVDLDQKVKQIKAKEGSAAITTIVADFSQFHPEEKLNGILMANALHFIDNPKLLLQKLSSYLLPNGKIMLIEYDNNIANPWVPYPISFKKLNDLTKQLHWESPIEFNRRKSRYGQGEMYGAVIHRVSL